MNLVIGSSNISRILSISAHEITGSFFLKKNPNGYFVLHILILKQKFVLRSKSGGKKWGFCENKIRKTI